MTDNVKWEYNGVEFKVGDRVRVVRLPQFRNGAMGPGTLWENMWVGSPDGKETGGMDDAITLSSAGVDFEILDISIEGVEFAPLVDCDSPVVEYLYPLSSLEKVFH